MKSELTPDQKISLLQSQNKRLKKLLLFLIPVAIVPLLILFYELFRDLPFWGPSPVPDKIAASNIDRYRRWGTRKYNTGYLVYYDYDSLKKYMDTVFPEIRDRQMTHTARQNPGANDKSAWKVGFYCMVKKDIKGNGNHKHDFYLVPIFVDPKGKKKVYDYFEENDTFYQHPSGTEESFTLSEFMSSSAGGKKSNVYDEGTLWP